LKTVAAVRNEVLDGMLGADLIGFQVRAPAWAEATCF